MHLPWMNIECVYLTCVCELGVRIFSYRRFKPNFYNRSTEQDKALGVQRGEMPLSFKKRHIVPLPEFNGFNGHKNPSSSELERRFSDPIKETNYEEVWFAGCHCGT